MCYTLAIYCPDHTHPRIKSYKCVQKPVIKIVLCNLVPFWEEGMGPSHHVSQETLIGVGQNRTLKLVKIVSEYFTAGFDKLYVRNETRQGQICPPPGRKKYTMQALHCRVKCVHNTPKSKTYTSEIIILQ